jgi:hypothetical protein
MLANIANGIDTEQPLYKLYKLICIKLAEPKKKQRHNQQNKEQ